MRQRIKFIPKSHEFGGGKLCKVLIKENRFGDRFMDVYYKDERYTEVPTIDETFGQATPPPKIREMTIRGKQALFKTKRTGLIEKILKKLGV